MRVPSSCSPASPENSTASRAAFVDSGYAGIDPYNGQSYEHGREWIERQIHVLAEVFAVGIHKYAVMNNHVHIVIRVESQLIVDWIDQQVAERGVALHCSALFPIRHGKPESKLGA